MASSMIETILQEKRVFKPSPAFVKQANISGMDAYKKMVAEAERDFEGLFIGKVPVDGGRTDTGFARNFAKAQRVRLAPRQMLQTNPHQLRAQVAVVVAALRNFYVDTVSICHDVTGVNIIESFCK